MSEFRRRLMMQSKKDNPILNDYLTIVALEDGLTAKLSVNACEYCVDGNGVWKTLPADTETETVNAGQTLSFRANLTPISNSGIGTFTVNKYYNLKGNCMSLLFGDDAKDCFSLGNSTYIFYRLFYNNAKLLNASGLVLQATILIGNCYRNMFEGCTSLQESPQLPSMSLTEGCYGYMFKNCTSLTKAPDLLATKLAFKSYAYMFYGCSNLNYIRMLSISLTTNYADNWVSGVGQTGIFIKNINSNWDVIGVSGVPEGWTIIKE